MVGVSDATSTAWIACLLENANQSFEGWAMREKPPCTLKYVEKKMVPNVLRHKRSLVGKFDFAVLLGSLVLRQNCGKIPYLRKCIGDI